MRKRFLAVILPASAFASAAVSASTESRDPYESCLTTQALSLERTGVEVDEVIAKAERACRAAKTGLTETAAGDVSQLVRLAVIQQRTNARTTVRRF